MTEKIQWHVEQRNLDELKPHPDNARIFTEKGMADLKKSINSIGMAQPINITPDGTVLSGHARLMALKEQGVQSVDVYVPNRELTAKEQQEVLIRMNANIAGVFDWDKAANVFELDDLIEWGCEIPDMDADSEKDDSEKEDLDITKKKVKISINFTDSHDVIDAFLKEMSEKHPELIYEVEIND